MAKENKVQIYNRLFFKLYLNYAVMLLVTAIMICLIFMNLYERTTMNNKEKQLTAQAEHIATRMTGFIKSEQYDDFFEYLDTLEEISDFDTWTISNPFAVQPMNKQMETTSYEEISSTQDYTVTVRNAFQNIIKPQTSYDEIYEVPTITIAVPVFGENREVVGAVLLKSMVEGQREIIHNSLYLIVISSVVALAISFIIIIVFATELSLPISRMRVTALELAAGNYHGKTGIKRKDEIGDLAKTVDILSDKLLENEIQRKNLDQMRLDFFANVSHELRTPITVLRAYAETLIDGVVTDEEKVTQYYGRMLSECKSMERLVGDLMLLSKMQNPDFYIKKEAISLIEIVDDIMRSASTIAEKKNINIEVTQDGPEAIILGDYDRIKQMLLIILDNAIKFSDENKIVHINLSNTDKIRVSIRDEGIGIDPADIDNIFEKFYKSNLRQNASGTGLGLAIAKQIAMKHEGTINVESTVGVGTTFIFTFSNFEMDSSIYQLK